MLSLKYILYVATVVEEQSFSKAAAKLYISQPALSQTIQKLEFELGIPLFIRENNTIRPTPACRIFVEDGVDIIKAAKKLNQKMIDIVNIKEGNLRIGISPFYSEYHLSRILPYFKKQFPGVSLKLTEEISQRLEELTLEDLVDFCMAPLPLSYENLEYQILQQEQILFAMPHNHPLTDQLTPALSNNLPFINLCLAKNEPFIFLKNQRFTEMGLRLCREAGFVPKILYETKNWDTVRAFIANGLGVGFLPEVLVSSEHDHNSPDCYRIIAENTTRPYAVVYKNKNHLSAAAVNFIRVAQEVFQKKL